MTYNYKAGSNQLDYIRDDVGDYDYEGDIDTQQPGNYKYDAIGNLIGDNKEYLNIEWNVYGKIKRVQKMTDEGTITEYAYDAQGNRIMKRVYKPTGFSQTSKETITNYVRDAQGNILAVYESGYSEQTKGSKIVRTTTPLTLKEQNIYGSSRIGIINRNFDVSSTVNITGNTIPGIGVAYDNAIMRGSKLFELSNHLGNVLVTVSDKKKWNATTSSYDADIVSASDYYPFGMQMPGRNVSSDSYRYGFNGKEKMGEYNSDNYDYGLRIYDSRIGKFLSVDPLTRSYPYYTPYQFAGNMPIIAIDLDGKEPKYMIDANGKLTKPVIALLMSAFGGVNSDWSEKRLENSIWKKDESLRGSGHRAQVNPLVNGQTIIFNPEFEEVHMKKFSTGSKFEPWLNLIAHEEYHIMEQDWGVVSQIVAGFQSIFAKREKKWLEAPAYSYGDPFSTTTEVAKLIQTPEGLKLYSILSDPNESEQNKIREVSLIGLNYNKQQTTQDRTARVSWLTKKGFSTDKDTLILLLDKRLKDIEQKINELSPPASNKQEQKKTP